MMNPFVDMDNHDIRSKFQGISNVSDLASFLQISRKSLAYYSNKKFTERH